MIMNKKGARIRNTIEYLIKVENTLDDLMKDFDNFDFTNSRQEAIIESRNNLIVLRTYFEGELE